MVVTIMDVAIARGAKADASGCISGAEFARVSMPITGSCVACGAQVAAYNSSPTDSGYIMCTNDCADENGFNTVEAFEAYMRGE